MKLPNRLRGLTKMTIKTYNDYRKDLELTAYDIVETYQREHLGEALDDSSDLYDEIYSASDSTCVYHYTNKKILEYSRNSDYANNNGLVEASDDINELTDTMAFYAYMQDLTETLDVLIENLDQELYSDDTIYLTQYAMNKLHSAGVCNRYTREWLNRGLWLLNALHEIETKAVNNG
jgi:hypothetical protein